MAKQTKKTAKEIVKEVINETAPAPVVSNRGERQFETLVSSAKFIKWNEAGESFEGTYLREVLREKDGIEENQKAGSVMGYLFVDDAGEEHIVGNSHQITRAINDGVKSGKIIPGETKLFIEYGGKVQNSKKQPVNTFFVGIPK